MRTYEVALVFDPALEVEQIETELRKLNDQISATGIARRWERWGKRRLAYEILSRQYGYYVIGVFDSEPGQVAELDRGIRINPVIIRHLISAVDPRRVPVVDEESVRTLGAGPEARELQPAVTGENAGAEITEGPAAIAGDVSEEESPIDEMVQDS